MAHARNKRYKQKTRVEYIHITVPSYLLDFIEDLARAHDTTRSYEIGVCILLRLLNVK